MGFCWKKWEVRVSDPKQALCPQSFAITWPSSQKFSLLTDLELIIYSTIGKSDVGAGLLGNVEKYRLFINDLKKSIPTSKIIFLL